MKQFAHQVLRASLKDSRLEVKGELKSNLAHLKDFSTVVEEIQLEGCHRVGMKSSS